MDELRAAIQQVLDAAGDGWSVNQFVVAMGLERITSRGEVEAVAWWIAPSEQPDWMTDALLSRTLDDRASQETE